MADVTSGFAVGLPKRLDFYKVDRLRLHLCAIVYDIKALRSDTVHVCPCVLGGSIIR